MINRKRSLRTGKVQDSDIKMSHLPSRGVWDVFWNWEGNTGDVFVPFFFSEKCVSISIYLWSLTQEFLITKGIVRLVL